MKIKLIECTNAYLAVCYLMQMEWGYEDAYILMRLRRALQEHIEFYATKERELSEKYGEKKDGKVTYSENGSFRFESEESAKIFSRKKLELANVEADINWIKEKIKRPEKIKPIHLEALEAFIDFGGDEA